MKFVVMLLFATLSFLTLHADQNHQVYQGQKTYMVKLRDSVKMDAKTFAAQNTTEEWNTLFRNDAEMFIRQYSARYPKAKRYLHSVRFRKSIPSLHAFVVTYAKNSGKTPQCTCAI